MCQESVYFDGFTGQLVEVGAFEDNVRRPLLLVLYPLGWFSKQLSENWVTTSVCKWLVLQAWDVVAFREDFVKICLLFISFKRKN